MALAFLDALCSRPLSLEELQLAISCVHAGTLLVSIDV